MRTESTQPFNPAEAWMGADTLTIALRRRIQEMIVALVEAERAALCAQEADQWSLGGSDVQDTSRVEGSR